MRSQFSKSSALHAAMERTTRSRIFETILKESPGAVSGNGAPAAGARPAAARNPVPPTKSEFQVCRERGQRAEDHGDYQTAVAEYLRAILSSGSPQVLPVDRIGLYLSLGRCQQRRHHFPEARMAFQQAQQLITASPSPAALSCEQVEVDAHLGSLEFALGDIRKAEAHLVAAINRYEEHCQVHPRRLSRLYVALASVYTEAALLDHAMEVALKGLTYLEECPEPVEPEKMRMFQLLATIACKKDQREAAVRHLLEAYRFAGLTGSQRDLIELEVLLATVYSQYGQDREACAWYEAAVHRQEVTGDQAEWPLSLLYLCLGQLQARSSDPAALQTLHRSLDLQLSHLYLSPAP